MDLYDELNIPDRAFAISSAALESPSALVTAALFLCSSC